MFFYETNQTNIWLQMKLEEWDQMEAFEPN